MNLTIWGRALEVVATQESDRAFIHPSFLFLSLAFFLLYIFIFFCFFLALCLLPRWRFLQKADLFTHHGRDWGVTHGLFLLNLY